MSDLGGLGAESGAPLALHWIPGNPLPAVLPLFLLLALFLFKKNRTGSAWLVFLPVICGFAIQFALRALPGMDSDGAEIFSQAILGGTYALAALWLLSFLLERKHLFLVLLGSVGILLAFAAARLAFALGTSPDWQMLTVSLILMALGLPVTALALTVAGWRARRQFRPFRFTIWALVVILLGWFLASAPFLVFSAIEQGRVSHVAEFYVAMLVAVGITFAVLLPFLLLSFASRFYRERLKAWLHLDREELPPVVGLAPPPIEAVATAAK